MGSKADQVFPVSQNSYSAALAAGLPMGSPFFSKPLSVLSLDAIDRAADCAVSLAIAHGDPRGDFDRTALWHNAREQAYLKRATLVAIRTVRPGALVAMGDENDSDAQAIARVAARLGLECRLVTRPTGAKLKVPTMLDPPPHAVADFGVLARTGNWTCVLGVGATDWHLLLPQLREPRRSILVIVDGRHSGDLATLYRAAALDTSLSVLPLWRETPHQYNERGDNSRYSADVRRVLSEAVAARPMQAAVCDLRRTETAVAMDCFRRAQLPLAIFAHAGASMIAPYRFSDAELRGARIMVWTATAARDYGGAEVMAPRRIRTDPLRRAGRWARRVMRAVAPNEHPCIGVVVTSDALFAAPE